MAHNAGTRAMHTLLPDEITGYAFDSDSSWWSSIVPEASRNMIINPSFEAWDGSDDAPEYTFGGSGGTVDFVEFPSVGASAGRRCAKIILGGTERYIEYSEDVVLSPGPYSFSLDVYVTQPGTRLQLTVYNAATPVATKTVRIDTSGWQRLSLSYNELGTGARTPRLTVLATSPATTTVYTDAWQFEAKAYPTTYLDGDMVDFYDLRANQSFFWEGTAHGSPSVRRENVAIGGRVIAWSDEVGFRTTSIVGLSMGTMEPRVQVLSDGSEIFLGANLRAPRDFTITGRIFASSYPLLQTKVRELVNLLRPNYTRDGAQRIVRYQPTDGQGRATGVPLDILCAYRDGMGGAITNFYQQNLAVQFHSSQPYLTQVVDSAAELQVSELLYNNPIIFKDEDGDYINLSTDAFDAFVRKVDFDAQGRPLAVGPFTTIGGSAIADAAYWDGTAWQQLGAIAAGVNQAVDGGWRFGFNTVIGGGGGAVQFDAGTDTWSTLDAQGLDATVQVVLRDVSGDVYIGGDFDNNTGATAPEFSHIVRWDYVSETYEAMGEGVTHTTLSATVLTILVHDNLVYVGGIFDEAHQTGGGPAVAANYVARWNPATGTWSNLSSGFNDTVNKLLVGEDGFVYAVGDFDRDGGDDFDLRGIARWNGNEWEEPFALMNASNVAGAAGAAVDEKGIMWFFDSMATSASWFDVSQTIAISETFGWKDGVFYPSFVRNSLGLQDLAIGPGNRVLFAHLNFDDPPVPAVAVPAMNEIDYAGDADAPIVIHLNGEMQPISILNLDTDGGVYFLPTLTIGANEEMVIRTDIQRAIMYSESRPNLYRYMTAGSSSSKLLYLRPGINRISIFADDQATSSAWLSWKNRYWGIEASF